MVDKLKAEEALPGRDHSLFGVGQHSVLGGALSDFEHYPHKVMFGMGCFWGVERLFWRTKGVRLTAAGYAGGYTPFPTYDEVCSGLTGHAEVVAVAYDPAEVSFRQLLTLFWESHDPTQGMRQGNDIGSQYRSAIYCTSAEDLQLAEESLLQYQVALQENHRGAITTELLLNPDFYFAEPYHQQYLDANPNGYCGLRGTGVVCALS